MNDLVQILTKPMDRRTAMRTAATGITLGLAWLETACSPLAAASDREQARLNWEEVFPGQLQDHDRRGEAQDG